MATIKDVAQLAGVSTSTASRAMHDNPLISDKTKRKVLKAMKKLDYEPNFAAQNLANQVSNTIGVILPFDDEVIFQNPFFMEIILGINRECNEKKIMVTIAAGTNETDLKENIETMIKRGNVRKFILLYSRERDHILEYLKKQKVHYTVIGKPYEDVNATSYVDNDNILAAEDATRFLYDVGHREICYLDSDERQMVQKDRKMGYQKVMQEHDLDVNVLTLPLGDHAEDKQKLQRYLKGHSELTAFVACDDIVGLKLQQLLESVGAKAHADYAIIGFNNSLFAKAAHPSMTSVEVFPQRLGQEAAKLALQTEEADSEGIKKVIVPHQIVVRNSVKKI